MEHFAAKDVKVSVLRLTDIAKHVGTDIGGTHVTSDVMRSVRLKNVTNPMEGV